ncbi:MAG: hypothetical protein Q8P56_05485, partial [Candidatus Uhrbacteria bacterium]|nr:hypothetical protein [Candidatus Uhrbacteria bacterium]
VCSWLLSSGRISDYGLITPAWRCRLNDYHAYLIERFLELFARELWYRFDAADRRDLYLALDHIQCPEYLDLVVPAPVKTTQATQVFIHHPHVLEDEHVPTITTGDVGVAAQDMGNTVEVKATNSVTPTEVAIAEPTRFRISRHLRAEVNSLEPSEFFWHEGERRFWWIDKVLPAFADLATLIDAVWAGTYREDIAAYEERERCQVHRISVGTVLSRLEDMDVWDDWDESEEESADIDEDRLATHVADCVARTEEMEDSV